MRYLSDAGYRSSDIELELATLDKKLAALRIEVREKPEYVGAYQIDEKALEEALEAEVKYGDERQKARVHDVDCLSAVYRLRKGQEYYHFEDCVALFLTTNAALSRVAWRFFKKETSAADGTVPIAVTDHLLTTILWLKKPMSAPDLPRKHIIADCYAAMEPGEHLWQKYLAEISRLEKKGNISSDDYYLLRSSLHARAELMDITKGDENAFVEGTPQEILERVEQSIRAEAEAELREERRLREEAEQKVRRIQTRQQARREARDLKIEGASRSLAYGLSRAIYFILVILLLVGAYASFPRTLPDIRSEWLRYLLPAGQVILVVMSILDLVFGTTVRGYLRSFEVLLAKRLNVGLKRLFSALAAYFYPASD